ncbi:MAG: anti-sigma factor [Gemmatimonadetes bacterium]|nr:anti-sigma factor [Gemmatimonadota bacterium]
MSPFTRDQLRELASGYALGALTPEETAAVEAALSSDAELAAEVAAYRETMAVMMRAEAPIAPRSALRTEWMRRVQAKAPGVDRDPQVRSLDARRRPARATPWLAGALAASFVGVCALSVQLLRTQSRLDQAILAEAKRERQLNTVLEAEGGLMVAMLAGAGDHGQGVQFFWNVRQGRGMVHAFHLPPAPAGRAYQLWVLRGSQPISARVFDSDPDGHALVEKLDLPATPDGITKVAITIEPAGGSPQPTTTPILVGDLLRSAGS